MITKTSVRLGPGADRSLISGPPRLGVIEKKKEDAAAVDYDRKIKGALCPDCGLKGKVDNTLPIEGETRIRYHKCDNDECERKTFKSVETV